MTEAEQRAAVVAEARSWCGTPYHPRGRIKGPHGGVDCALVLAEVYQRAGMIARVTPPHYPPDWHLHCKEGDERFIATILSCSATEFSGPPRPGDVVAYKIGHAYAHAAIVVGWPRIIHSDLDARRVTPSDGTKGRHAVQNDGRPRPMRFFTLWPEHAA